MTDINNPRTLSGVNSSTIRQIQLPSTEDAILIDGFEGLKGQGIFKNDITGKLEWDFAQSASIPPNSIKGSQLRDDITINTTGNIDANIIKGTEVLTNVLALPKSGAQTLALTNQGITLVGQQQITAGDSGATFNNLSLTGGGGVDPTIQVLNGNVNLVNGDLECVDIEATGSVDCNELDCVDLNVSGHTGTIVFNEIDTNKIQLPSTGVKLTNIEPSLIQSPIIRADFFECPKALGGLAPMVISPNGISMTGSATTLGGTLVNGTLNELTINGTNTPSGLVCLGDIILTNTGAGGGAGNITTTGVITIGGTGTSSIAGATRVKSLLIPDTGATALGIDTTGNIDSTAGTITMGGLATFKGSCDFIGGGVDFKDAGNNLQTRINNTTGNYTSISGDITTGGTISGGLLTYSTGIQQGTTLPSPFTISGTGDIATINGNYTSTNGDITLTNGDITLTNGTLRGNVEGTITEEHIDAESLNLRQNPNGQGTPQGILLQDGFLIRGYTGDLNSTLKLDLSSATGIMKHCGVQQTLGTASNSFASNTKFNAGGVDFETATDHIKNNSSTYRDNNVANPNTDGVRSVVIDGDGVKMFPSNAGSERLRIDRDGSVVFKSIIGSVEGFSPTQPNSLLNMTAFDQSNHMPHPRFVQICDPVKHSAYTTLAGAWYNMAGHIDNDVLKSRYTNADLSFTAYSTSARVNVIFSCEANNVFGVRFRMVDINGNPASVVFAGTQRLVHSGISKRGQFEYICYINTLALASTYIIVPEILCPSGSSLTMFVGSNAGSSTIQNADSPIIVEIAFMNRATINTTNIFVGK